MYLYLSKVCHGKSIYAKFSIKRYRILLKVKDLTSLTAKVKNVDWHKALYRLLLMTKYG